MNKLLSATHMDTYYRSYKMVNGRWYVLKKVSWEHYINGKFHKYLDCWSPCDCVPELFPLRKK